ncbi:hypothetical protein MJ863_07755 [Alcaligenes ammonioxydans]|uniref:hypothetical protein n=1 Tax=Alcaligenes TaxID=507 RepID=UPI000269E84A|nr:hypothetical protein [Alcaligenes ammonioxydans]EJC62683.1 hypothetical protein QWA_09756 [Alcaligenes faecalis subsp. faecalis NCIB 8687]QBH20265.1 hypothetical protein EYC51_12545 [Alcaligenes faecalis]MCH1879477.1 hypothetical protein [Alcaligenes ammonioxydans]WGQ36447.1 hypothetical protein QEZ63_04640 [Alcaligenes faecalis]HRK84597.1 hypothetical protein [Alcaligenes faecalis]
MKRMSLFSALVVSASLLGGTAAIAQETTGAAPTQSTQKQTRQARDHKPLTADEVTDIGPAYQRLKEAGYTKVGSLHQRGDRIMAMVVDKDGKVVRVRSEGENGAFTVVERKADGQHRRGHRDGKGQQTQTPASEQQKS